MTTKKMTSNDRHKSCARVTYCDQISVDVRLNELFEDTSVSGPRKQLVMLIKAANTKILGQFVAFSYVDNHCDSLPGRVAFQSNLILLDDRNVSNTSLSFNRLEAILKVK